MTSSSKETPAAEQAPADADLPVVGQELPLDWPRHELRIKATTELERKKRARPCRYEPFTVEWLEACVRPDDQVYDLGANVGTFSLMAAALIAEGGVPRKGTAGGTVFAFEPSYGSYARLCENILLNGLTATIVPVPLLVGSTSGLRVLAYRDTAPGASRHRLQEEGSAALQRTKFKPGHIAQKLLSMSLDDLVETCDLPPPTLMKIDVDGGELDVLRGARKALSSEAMRSVILEMEPGLVEPCMQLLKECGLELSDRFTTGHGREFHYAIVERRPQV